MPGLRPFHLAIPVKDITSTRRFYTGILGCSVGRSSETWIDFNFYGHQLSAHVKPEALAAEKTNPVDGDKIPVRHFGIVLDWKSWAILKQKLDTFPVDFLIEPVIRFKGEIGEQATLFIKDPSGNVLEFKAFKSDQQLFAMADEQS
jgi:uncharacterized protein